MFARLYERPIGNSDLLARGDYESAEILFELAADRISNAFSPLIMPSSCTFTKLDTAITRYEKERAKKGDAGKRAAEVLVYLYRVKAIGPRRRRQRKRRKQDELVERVLFQSARLESGSASYSYKPDQGNVSGFLAAYERLAGNTKAFNEKIAEIKKIGRGVDGGTGTALDATRRNARANDAIKILIDKKTEMG
jgi:hypothetical protein